MEENRVPFRFRMMSTWTLHGDERKGGGQEEMPDSDIPQVEPLQL
jgi:hypothetical protein